MIYVSSELFVTHSLAPSTIFSHPSNTSRPLNRPVSCVACALICLLRSSRDLLGAPTTFGDTDGEWPEQPCEQHADERSAVEVGEQGVCRVGGRQFQGATTGSGGGRSWDALLVHSATVGLDALVPSSLALLRHVLFRFVSPLILFQRSPYCGSPPIGGLRGKVP